MTILVITQWGLIWVWSQSKIGVGAEARAVEQLEIWLTPKLISLSEVMKVGTSEASWEYIWQTEHKMKNKSTMKAPTQVKSKSWLHLPTQSSLLSKTATRQNRLMHFQQDRCITQLAYENFYFILNRPNLIYVFYLGFCVWKWSAKATIPKFTPQITRCVTC